MMEPPVQASGPLHHAPVGATSRSPDREDHPFPHPAKARGGPLVFGMDRTARRRGWVRRTTILVGIGLVIGVLSSRLSMGQDTKAQTRPAETTSTTAGTSTGGGAKDKDAQLMKKLDQILANQQTILQKFDEVMEELRIIKVRTTIRTSSTHEVEPHGLTPVASGEGG
ncbi:MAG: hypothetical protein HYY58_05055 [Candidatus Omnitrophica bacterium]|nr:hypothetical protein [Candidatus Omnitrophota bacterium]